jgi:hypothetical protein
MERMKSYIRPGNCERLQRPYPGLHHAAQGALVRVIRALGWAMLRLCERLERQLTGESQVRPISRQGIGTLATALEIRQHNCAVFYRAGRAGYVRVGVTDPTYYVVIDQVEDRAGAGPDEVGVDPPLAVWEDSTLIFLSNLGLYRLAAPPYCYRLETEALARCMRLAARDQ